MKQFCHQVGMCVFLCVWVWLVEFGVGGAGLFHSAELVHILPTHTPQ